MSQLVDPIYLSLKAAAASAFAIFLTQQLGGSDLLSAGFVALACTSPSAYAGLRRGLQQTAGSLLGALAAWLPSLLFPSSLGNPAVLAVSMTIALLLCFRLRLGAAYIVTGFTVLYLHILPFPSFNAAFGGRMLAVALGILSATLINSIVTSFGSSRIIERRLRIARDALASELKKLAAYSSSGSPLPDFEHAFAAIVELRQDLIATSAERIFPGAARARSSAQAGLLQAVALRDAAHLSRELSLLLEHNSIHSPELDEFLKNLVRMFEGGITPNPPTLADPVLTSVAHRLVDRVKLCTL